MSNPRMLGKAAEIAADQRYCTCCKKPLKGKLAWLELDQRSNTYHDHGGVPPDKSQGWFVFGLTCARNMLAEFEFDPDENDESVARELGR